MQPILVLLSTQRWPRSKGSNVALKNLKTILACSIDPAKSTDSVPERNRSSSGCITLDRRWAASQDFPFPRGRLRAATSTPGAVAARMNRFWNGSN